MCHSIVCLSPPPCVHHVDAAKYLLIRLCLRKSGKWHRLSSLKYQHELGEEMGTALETLCIYPKQCLTEERPVEQEKREVIDLTLDEIDTMKPSFPLFEHPMAEAGPSSIKIEDLSLSEQSCGDLSFFAQDHTHAELTELLECLSLEELKRLAKDMKIRGGFGLNVSNLSVPVLEFSVLFVQRMTIEDMLIKQASSQAILPFLSVHKGSKASRRPVARKPLPRVRKSQCDRLRQMVMKILGTSQLPLCALA